MAFECPHLRATWHVRPFGAMRSAYCALRILGGHRYSCLRQLVGVRVTNLRAAWHVQRFGAMRSAYCALQILGGHKYSDLHHYPFSKFILKALACQPKLRTAQMRLSQTGTALLQKRAVAARLTAIHANNAGARLWHRDCIDRYSSKRICLLIHTTTTHRGRHHESRRHQQARHREPVQGTL
jgi:hypothetical protein